MSRGRGYDPRIFAMHQTVMLNENLDEQRWLKENPDFVSRLERIEQTEKLLMLYMGRAEYRAWARDALLGVDPDNSTTEWGIKLDKKLSEICPDSLLSEVILLEHRREVILEEYAQSDSQEELSLELAEIQTSLRQYHGRLDDMSEARLCAKYGSSL